MGMASGRKWYGFSKEILVFSHLLTRQLGKTHAKGIERKPLLRDKSQLIMNSRGQEPYTFSFPKNLRPGEYVVRHEILALHPGIPKTPNA